MMDLDDDWTRAASKDCIDLNSLFELAESAFISLPEKGDVTSWMDLMRTCRQPQIMWKVDYIELKEQGHRINELIRESEKMLFVSSESIDLKKQYSADINQIEAFNTIRVHLKAEANEIPAASSMLESMLTKSYDNLSIIRQSNLLYHGCLVFLCCKNLELSYHCMEKHWALLKYANPTERIQQGLWDNQVLLQMAYWFFIKHSDSVRDFYSIRTKTPVNEIWNHKKIAALYFFEYDNSWIVSFCGLPFYEHARTLYPNLPAYEKKRSTPHNYDMVWTKDSAYSSTGETNAVGEEKYYLEQFNKEMYGKTSVTDIGKANDYLYSYYHYQVDYVEEVNCKMQLAKLLKEHISEVDIVSVLEAGTGIAQPPIFSYKRYLALNISTKVCSVLKDKGIPHVHGCASVSAKELEDNFDLCLAYDVFNHFTSSRLKMFLEACSEKCKYLLAAVDTRDDIRSDILNKNLTIKQINLHTTMMNPAEWRDYLEPYFNCHFKQSGPWIYIFGASK